MSRDEMVAAQKLIRRAVERHEHASRIIVGTAWDWLSVLLAVAVAALLFGAFK